MGKSISGFSKLSKSGKLRWLVENFFKDPEHAMRELMSYWLQNEDQQKVIDGFSENTISNYYLPYGIAPNFVINGKMYAVPMVTEESSVVAAASSAAKFWANRGGFHAIVIGQKKVGQIHFTWKGDFNKLTSVFEELKIKFLVETQFLTANMNKRGGGILDFELLNFTQLEPNYYQVKINFETCDSMGANFINSVLEECAKVLKHFIAEHPIFNNNERNISIIMSILSNFTPECLVRTWVECPVDALGNFGENMDATAFAEKFSTAIRIAEIDPYRATTHNKGIFNGIDAVVIATANDFRAIEACGHAYAARNGQYSSLSHCSIINNTFKFWMDIPLAVGTVGGLTTLHPIAKRSLELLGNPNAKELMLIIATTGLAQNFAAVRSLVTIGIQKGHMKMHLHNILN
ncbi:MAG: hydroxymethylglutaryl-CoA reductase, degradative, partial [Saprospiraceae bacterium]|nr:hydroxymethylglutaryl-CoA reductase, degradative [Saprospiraceae bacterium]